MIGLWQYISETKLPEVVAASTLMFVAILWLSLTLVHHRRFIAVESSKLTPQQEQFLKSLKKEAATLDQDIAKVDSFIGTHTNYLEKVAKEINEHWPAPQKIPQ